MIYKNFQLENLQRSFYPVQTNHPVLNEENLKGAFRLISNLSSEYRNETITQTDPLTPVSLNRTSRSVNFLESGPIMNSNLFSLLYVMLFACILMIAFLRRRLF